MAIQVKKKMIQLCLKVAKKVQLLALALTLQKHKEGAKILRILTNALQYKAKKTQVDSRQFWESIKPILYGKSPCVALWDLKGEGKFTRGNTFQCTLLNE